MHLALTLTVILAACSAEGGPKPLPPQSTCTADQLQGLVGQPASVLETMRFGIEMRVILPRMPVTQDYRVNRLNIAVDANEKISRVYCG